MCESPLNSVAPVPGERCWNCNLDTFESICASLDIIQIGLNHMKDEQAMRLAELYDKTLHNYLREFVENSRHPKTLARGREGLNCGS